jgi:ectoine hydroxylase-related dioxygenase (phytanoyl-CoA dioxygenase family)
MLTSRQISAYHEVGFVVVDFFDLDALREFRTALYNLVLVQLKKRTPLWEEFASKSGDEDHILNDALIALERADHSAISHIYDTLTSTSSLLKVLLNDEISDCVNQLLDRPSKSVLFLNSVSCRMDPPGENRFLYGWHHDKLTNIEGSRWVQLWLPAIGNLTKFEGGLEICPGSHNKNYYPQFDKIRTQVELESPGSIFRMPYRTAIDFLGLETKYLELKWGQGVLFKEEMLHRSGLNTSENRVRYCMTAFYHDATGPNFRYQSPRFQVVNPK